MVTVCWEVGESVPMAVWVPGLLRAERHAHVEDAHARIARDVDGRISYAE
jgi:hypothetical protein